MSRLDEHGNEVLDQTPLSIPLDCHHPPTIQQEIRRFIRTEASRIADEEGEETFEDSDDFDCGEDELFPDYESPYELDDDPPTIVENDSPQNEGGSDGSEDSDSDSGDSESDSGESGEDKSTDKSVANSGTDNPQQSTDT